MSKRHVVSCLLHKVANLFQKDLAFAVEKLTLENENVHKHKKEESITTASKQKKEDGFVCFCRRRFIMTQTSNVKKSLPALCTPAHRCTHLCTLSERLFSYAYSFAHASMYIFMIVCMCVIACEHGVYVFCVCV